MSKKFAFILGILSFFILSVSVKAENIYNCPYTIMSSGNYYVATDLTYSGTETCIAILATNVNLYCLNHTISGNETGRGIGIFASDHIQVYECKVRDFEDAINIAQSSYVTISNSETYSSTRGVYIEDNSQLITLDSVKSYLNTYGVFSTNSGGILIRNSEFWNNNVGVSMNWFDDFEIYNSRIHNNVFGLTMDNGILSYTVGNMIYQNYYGLRINNMTYLYMHENKVEDSYEYGMYLENFYYNFIYNNLFRNNVNVNLIGTQLNFWNTTKQQGRRIYGTGYGYIGGNYWSNPNGNGYSDTCPNADYDDFCDSPYTIGTNNIDYLPLASVSNITLEIQVTQEKCHLDADGCEQDVPSPTIIVKDIYGNVVASGTTNIQKPDCYTCGALKKPCYVARFNLLPAERYLVVISKSGYNTLEANVSAYYSFSYKFYLPRENEFTIGIKVKDKNTLQPITTVTRCLFYQNGTKVPDLYPNALFCAQLSNDGGRYDYYCVPRDSYYFTIQAYGYQTYTSDVFYLSSDVEKIVYLTPSVYAPVCGNGICEANETVQNCPQDCAQMGVIPQINVTEWQELGYGWLLPLFTPFALYNMMMIFFAIIGGVITKEPSVVLGIILVFIVIFTFIGIYPWWISFVLIIIAGFLFVRLIGHVFVRG
jgi:hypothetical protein